jgi:hypothetical protein
MAAQPYRISDEERRRRSDCMKQRNADPVFAAAARERIAQLHADPVFTVKQARAACRNMKRLNEDPSFREASRQRMRRMRSEREDDAEKKQ